MANIDRKFIYDIYDYSAVSTGVVPAAGVVEWFDNISTYTSSSTIVQIIGDGSSTRAQLVAAAFPVTPESAPTLDYQVANKRFVDDSISAIAAPYQHSVLTGCQISNNSTDSDHDIDISAGKRRDSTDAVNINLTSGMTIAIDASGAGGLDTGTVATYTWYAIHLIYDSAGDTESAVFSLSETSPTLPGDYDYFRRVGWVKTDGSGNIFSFSQIGDYYQFGIRQPITWGSLSTSRQAVSLPVPSGKKLRVKIIADLDGVSSGNTKVVLTDLDATDVTPNNSRYDLRSEVAFTNTYTGEVLTNSSGQIGHRASQADGDLLGDVIGWHDDLGAFDGV